MQYFSHKKSGYSIIIALFMVGFLLMMSIGILNLVLRELHDNKGEEGYLRTFSAAEGASELALLDIKKNGYGYYDSIEYSINNRSIMLSDNPGNQEDFNRNKDVFFSYDLSYKTQEYLGSIRGLGYDIIPLFSLSAQGILDEVKDMTLNISTGEESDLVWNIIGENTGISGVGNFNKNTLGVFKKSNDGKLVYGEEKIQDFLNSSVNNYLLLFNASKSTDLIYKIESHDTKYFTKPKTQIISSAGLGKYRQNIKVYLDNTEYLNILKYSVYSN